MQLSSERLIYLPVTNNDRENYMAWYTNDEVMKYITGKGLSQTAANERFIKAVKNNEAHPEVGLYLAKHRQSEEFIGIAKLTYMNDTQAEVGYGMMPAYWGMGYATEMLQCLVTYAQSIARIKELIGIVNPENLPSVKVLTKQGFELYEHEELPEEGAAYYRLKL